MTDLPLIDQQTDRRGHGKLHFQKALKYQDLLILIKQKPVGCTKRLCRHLIAKHNVQNSGLKMVYSKVSHVKVKLLDLIKA